MTVRIPGGGVIPVDSKVPLDAYIGALQPDADRQGELQRHARHVQEHVNKLADKNYSAHFERAPGVVVMFMPLESALMAALEINPNLHAEAMQRHVLIATPTLLVAVLRAVAYGWQQEAIARNAQEIADVGRALHDRLSVFVNHFARIGAQLHNASDSYNKAVGSLERNVLSGARKLKSLRATQEPDIETPDAVEIEIRPITAAELRQSSQPDDDETVSQARRLAAEPPLIDLMKMETEDALDARP
jgi:DNA recombination protein RmuC